MRAPRPIRLTNAEVALLRELCAGRSGRDAGTAASVAAKLDVATGTTDGPSAGDVVGAAMSALTAVLGAGNVAFPPHPNGEWFARTANYIKSRGYTADDWDAVGRGVSAAGWGRPYAFDSLVRNADRLMKRAGQPRAHGGLPTSEDL